jgi:hypothetical protein
LVEFTLGPSKISSPEAVPPINCEGSHYDFFA